MKPLSEQTIFVSIASYSDPMLSFTLKSALETATFPENLRLGIVDQSSLNQRLVQEEYLSTKHIRYVQLDPQDARGVCWARSIAMSLYQGEDWFFQVDAHTLFDPGWDQTMIKAALQCAAINPKCILSSYPNAFQMIDHKPVRKPVTQKVLGHVLANEAQFKDDNFLLGFQAVPVDSDQPIKGFHLGGGCIFAPGFLVNEVPYDPNFYFHGEEQSMAIRAYTHGWDIFHISGLPIWHLYFAETMELSRPHHWSGDHNISRKIPWWTLDKHSKDRFSILLNGTQNLGIYGLGTQRTLIDYALFCGIDYTNQTLGDTARRGPWVIKCPGCGKFHSPSTKKHPSPSLSNTYRLPNTSFSWSYPYSSQKTSTELGLKKIQGKC